MAQPTLKAGARGAAVRTLQEKLKALGLYGAAIDGDFGPGTTAAVQRLQRARGLTADGVVGPRTWRELDRPHGGSARPPSTTQPAGGTSRSLSAEGTTFIAQFEGFRANLYNDAAGHATIGFGHLVHRGRVDGSEPAEFKAGISRERALKLLRTDAQGAGSTIERAVTVPLNQAQFDALVSFVFNVGGGALQKSTLLRRLNAGEFDAVPAELAKWNKAGGRVLPGLTRRREAEGRLFSTGRYT